MEKEYYTWKEFEENISYFEAIVDMNNLNHIVTLFRGGLPLGTTLSNKCKLPLTILDYQSYDGDSKEVEWGICNLTKDSKILLVDDLADSGLSLNKAIKFLNSNGYKNIKVCTIHGNNQIHSKEWNYCNKHTGKWIVYPWE